MVHGNQMKVMLLNDMEKLERTLFRLEQVAAIFTGLSIIDRTSDMWVLKVMGGFVGWEALLYLLQELHFRLSQKGKIGC
ncbi:hypothetical protein JZ751_024993 [Albula glossodonta]|uniref:Uncharacterized protein n=1 Tax=Albula glossodonta TaxID=121402 RepID=A0A8T2PCK4_9TELE|nr:hypothetical protein JZ751_024993 [Albula glossodonta]